MSLKNNPTPIDMIRAIKELEEATASGGTAVSVAGTPVATLNFTSDPQTQLDNKANTDAIPTDYIKYDEDTAVDSNNIDTNYIHRSELINLIYPVGSIYMSVNNVSPQTFLGGTWVAWGNGRVPLAVGNNGETNYTASEMTGGSENSVAEHNHAFTGEKITGTALGVAAMGNKSHYTGAFSNSTISSATYGRGGVTSTAHTDLQFEAWTNGFISWEGEEGGNRMPFITCYMWKRTG